MKNYYRILEISEDASIEVIKAAYKAMSKKYHPDLYSGDKTQADTKMQEINEAYEILSDNNLKEEYDKALHSSCNAEEAKQKADVSNIEKKSNNNMRSYNGDNASGQGGASSCGGCIVWIIILIAVIYGIGWFTSNYNSCLGINSDESSSSTETVSKNFDKDSPEFAVSTFIDSSISLTTGNTDETKFNEVMINYTTKDFLEEAAGFKVDYENLDWVYELQSLINYEINTSDFVDKYNDLILNIEYNITDVNIDGDEAVLTVNLRYTDFPALILSAAKDVKSDSERSNNLGIKRNYGELFLEYLNKNTSKYSNALNDNIEFNLIKQNGNWKISKCDRFDTFIKVISVNIIKGNS